MERRSLLKGIGAAAAAIIGGGATTVTAKTLTEPNTPIGIADEKTLQELPAVGPVEPLGVSSKSPYAQHAEDCLAELKEYRKQFPREMLPSTQQLSLGELARDSRIRRDKFDPMPPLPAFAKLAEMGRENGGYTQICTLERLLGRGWKELTAEQLPKTFIHVPYMVRPTHALGPERINTARLRLDVCEMTAWTMADLAGVLLYDPLTYAKSFPVDSMRRSCGQAFADVYRAITPLKHYARREAFVLETFTYFEVFACYADTDEKVLHMLTSVAPTLLGKSISELPCVPKDVINKELGIEPEADLTAQSSAGGERGRLASLLAAQFAQLHPAERMRRLARLSISDKVLYDVVYDTLRQLRDAGLVKA